MTTPTPDELARLARGDCINKAKRLLRALWRACFPPPVKCRQCGADTVHDDHLCTNCWWDTPYA